MNPGRPLLGSCESRAGSTLVATGATERGSCGQSGRSTQGRQPRRADLVAPRECRRRAAAGRRPRARAPRRGGEGGGNSGSCSRASGPAAEARGDHARSGAWSRAQRDQRGPSPADAAARGEAGSPQAEVTAGGDTTTPRRAPPGRDSPRPPSHTRSASARGRPGGAGACVLHDRRRALRRNDRRPDRPLCVGVRGALRLARPRALRAERLCETLLRGVACVACGFRLRGLL